MAGGQDKYHSRSLPSVFIAQYGQLNVGEVRMRLVLVRLCKAVALWRMRG